MLLNITTQIQKESRPWEDWEDHGGFDDEESLMGVAAPKRSIIFLEKPWYYEKKRNSTQHPITFGIQISFLLLW